ncbi:MAG: pyridoxal 5'-phosphate synthase lyase subunit PdxS, partial [Nitrososphaerales archaeon]
IRTKGEPGTGNVAEAIKHFRILDNEISSIRVFFEDGNDQELIRLSRELRVSYDLVLEVGRLRRLPVVNFAAGGIATPADAANMMAIGCDGIFVGSGIYKAEDPVQRARAVVLATTFFNDAKVVSEAQKMVDEKKSMLGLDVSTLEYRMQDRGGEA